MVIRRGEIYWVDFKGALGVEIRKTRPAVVVSCDDHNELAGTVTVAPLSSSSSPIQPHEVEIPSGNVGDGRAGRIKTHQLRAVDKRRLERKLGVLPEKLLWKLEESLRVHFALDRL